MASNQEHYWLKLWFCIGTIDACQESTAYTIVYVTPVFVSDAVAYSSVLLADRDNEYYPLQGKKWYYYFLSLHKLYEPPLRFIHRYGCGCVQMFAH